MPTHEVLNQAPPLVGYSALDVDAALLDGLGRLGDEATLASLTALGRRVGDPDVHRWATQVNEHPPVLRTHDRSGRRIDEVEFHPAWHALMALSVGEGLHATPWTSADPHAHLRRAAGFYLISQAEAGHGCPISMTYAVLPALRHNAELTRDVEAGLRSRTYDFGLRDPAGKAGLIAGMAMTEKQGGSDVRANTTRAVEQPDRDLAADRSQVVLLRADVGPVPRARPGRGCRSELLLRTAGAARRRAQCLRPATAQGQARQPVERLGRGRVRRHRRPARRRARSGPEDHPRDGHDDPAGLRDRLGRRATGGAGPGGASRPSPAGVRGAADRPAGDAGRAGGPAAGGGGGDNAGAPAGGRGGRG